MELPSAYAIANVDTHQSPMAFIERLFVEGVQLLQLRTKTFSDSDFLKLAQAVQEKKKLLDAASPLPSRRLLIINDRIDICMLSGADGVHLGQGDESPLVGRERLGPAAIIGLSTHSAAQIQSAPHPTLNYLAVGPIFHSPTKSGHAPEIGITELRRLRELSPLPIVGIGGISDQNCKTVFEAGAESVAMISAFERSDNVVALLNRIEEHRLASKRCKVSHKSQLC